MISYDSDGFAEPSTFTGYFPPLTEMSMLLKMLGGQRQFSHDSYRFQSGHYGPTGAALRKTRTLEQAFIALYKREASKGSFSIFKEAEFGTALTSLAILKAITRGPHCDIATSLMIDAQSENFDGLYSILKRGGEELNPSNLSLLWSSIKSCSKLEDDPNFSKLEDYELRQAALAFLQLPQLKEEEASEISKILIKFKNASGVLGESFLLILKAANDHFKAQLGFKASPFFVELANPEFYKAELSRRQIDVNVAEVLKDSWDEDFTSFLDAAESLSADK